MNEKKNHLHHKIIIYLYPFICYNVDKSLL